MSERFIDLGNRKWKNPQPRELQWRESKNGNPYAQHGDKTVVIVATRRGGKFILAVVDGRDAPWQWQHGSFDSLEDAKEGALRVFFPKRTPVPSVASDPEAGGRKIDL